MHKIVSWFSISIIAIYCGLASAQDAYGVHPYPETHAGQQFMGARQPDRFLRWRPLDEEGGGAADGMQSGQSSGSGFIDYTDEPRGAPSGTYRRIDQRHTITPHLEGYRFRPIDPAEQLSSRSRNETQARSNRERIFSQAAGSTDGTGVYSGGGSQGTLIYRPDPRFDKGANQGPPRYAFPMGTAAPMFRQY